MASSNGPSRTVLVAAVILALGAIGLSNTLVQRVDPKEQERLQKEAEQKAADDAAKKASPAPAASGSPAAKTAANAGDANTLASLGPDAILGNASGTRTIEVRWNWTPAVEADPAKVWNAVQAIQSAAPDAKIHLINADANPQGGESGVFVNGKLRVIAAPDGSLPANDIIESLKQK